MPIKAVKEVVFNVFIEIHPCYIICKGHACPAHTDSYLPAVNSIAESGTKNYIARPGWLADLGICALQIQLPPPEYDADKAPFDI